MSKLISALLIVSLFLYSVIPSQAEDEVRKLNVDLKAKGFTQSTWMDNLEKDSILFGPGDKFQVQLTVRNEGNRNQTWVELTQSIPSVVTTDLPSNFRIPQIAAGESYVKNITLTVKDKTQVLAAIKSATYRLDIKSEAGTTAGDFTVFYTNSGTKTITTSNQPIMPATGATSTLLLGSLIALLTGGGALALRRAVRGY